MTKCEIRTCPKCWRPVSCQYDGDSYVGQCNWCGKMLAYQYCPKEDEPAPKQEPKLLGVRVDYWDDEHPARSKFFEDPDEGSAFAESCEADDIHTIIWPVYEEAVE